MQVDIRLTSRVESTLGAFNSQLLESKVAFKAVGFKRQPAPSTARPGGVCDSVSRADALRDVGAHGDDTDKD